MNHRTLYTVALGIVLLFSAESLSAQSVQWTPTDGPYGGAISRLTIDSSGRPIAVAGGTAFRFDKNADRWSSLVFASVEIKDLTVTSNGTLIGGTEGGGVIRSTDGISWAQANTGVGDLFIWAVAATPDGRVFAGSQFGSLYLSTDDGASWTPIAEMPQGVFITSLAAGSQEEVLIGGPGGLYRASPNGTNWSVDDMGLAGRPTMLRYLPNGDLLAGTAGRLYRYRRNGGSWSVVDDDTVDGHPLGLAVRGERVVVVTTAGVYTGSPDGGDWVKQSAAAPPLSQHAVAAGDEFYVATVDGVETADISVDPAEIAFRRRSDGLEAHRVRSLAVGDDGELIAGTSSGSIYRSTVSGAAWRQVAILPDAAQLNSGFSGVNRLAVGRGSMWASTYGAGVLRSTDNGKTWIPRNVGLPTLDLLALAIDSGGGIIVAPIEHGLYRSTDDGESWAKLSYSETYAFPLAVAPNGDILSGFFRDLKRSTDNGQTWGTVASFGINIASLLPMKNGDIYVGTGVSGVSIPSELARVNADGSTTRLLSTQTAVNAVISTPSGFYAAIELVGVYHSPDRQSRWDAVNSGLDDPNVQSLAVTRNGERMFLGATTVLTSSLAVPSSVASDRAGSDRNLMLGGCSPNPARERTVIPFRLGERSRTLLEVYSAVGAGVATLVSDDLPAGSYSVEWNTEAVESGVYWYRLQTESGVRTASVVVVK